MIEGTKTELAIKILTFLGSVSAIVGCVLLSYGVINDKLEGYIPGGIFLLIAIILFTVVIVLINKQKNQMNQIVNEMSLHFFDRKETSFERMYFNYSNNTRQSVSVVNETPLDVT